MKINTPFVEKILTRFIRTELSRFGYKNGILGLSGGIDSTVAAYLSAHALGPDHVIGLILPYGDTFQRDVDDAEAADAVDGESILDTVTPSGTSPARWVVFSHQIKFYNKVPNKVPNSVLSSTKSKKPTV